MILAQVPIVLSLVMLLYQAFKTFKIAPFKLIFIGFGVNLFYLILSLCFCLVDKINLSENAPINSTILFTTILDMTSMIFLGVPSIISLSLKKQRFWLIIFIIFLIIASFSRIIPNNPDKDLIPYFKMRYIPFSFINFVVLLLLSLLLFKITSGYKGNKSVCYGSLFWASIQFLAIFEDGTTLTLFKHKIIIEDLGFALGLFAKSAILFGLFKYIIAKGLENSNKKEIASKLDVIFGVTFHEFTHPLRGLKTILKEINPEDHTKAPKYIDVYKKNAEKIDAFYNHLLAITSASLKMYVEDTGKLLINDFYNNLPDNEEVTESINTTIQIVVFNLKSTIQPEYLERIKFDYNMGGNCIVKYNPKQLYQVFQNIFKNAIEAIGNNQGVITIKTRLKHNCDDRTSKQVLVEICDSGPGIDINIADHIFSNGFSTKSTYGRGFGLAISKKLVEQNLGELKLFDYHENKNNIPAHFVITFPKAEVIF